MLHGLADEDGDAQHGVGHGEDGVGPARRALGEDEAAEVGASLDRGVDVLLPRQAADLDERPREQLPQLGAGLRRAHQRRADEDGVRASELGGGRLRARVDGALGDHDPVARRLRHQLELRGAVDPEGAEVARIDPDHRGAEAGGALELVLVVSLDERVETELVSGEHELRGRRVVEVAEDEERGVGARLPYVAEVLLGREEALGEQRQADTRARRTQVVERAGERVVDEHRDGARSSGLVRGHDVLHPRAGTDVAGRGRAAFELGDRAEARGRECVRELHERENSTSSSSRAAAAPESIASRACARPSRMSSASLTAAIPPAALSSTAERWPPSAPASTSRRAAAFEAGRLRAVRPGRSARLRGRAGRARTRGSGRRGPRRRDWSRTGRARRSRLHRARRTRESRRVGRARRQASARAPASRRRARERARPPGS